jgi:hypothetical protein
MSNTSSPPRETQTMSLRQVLVFVGTPHKLCEQAFAPSAKCGGRQGAGDGKVSHR